MGGVGVPAAVLVPAPVLPPPLFDLDCFDFPPPDPPDERLMAELRRRYRPEVEALSEYLGRDLIGQWGYDDVG